MAISGQAKSEKVDGRTLQVTGRTLHFATKVHPDWKARLHQLAQRTGRMYCEVLEDALAALEWKLDVK